MKRAHKSSLLSSPMLQDVAAGHARIGLPALAFSNVKRALSSISRQLNSEHSYGRMSDPMTLNMGEDINNVTNSFTRYAGLQEVMIRSRR